MTTLTDYVLATQAAVYAWRWRDRVQSGGAAARLFVAGLIAVVVAATAGGTSHGFRIPLGDCWSPVWTLTVWSIAASAVLMVAAALRGVGGALALDAEATRLGRAWLGLGFAITAIGVALMVAGVSPHRHFNHNDLYHVVQMVGLWAIERGQRFLTGRALTR